MDRQFPKISAPVFLVAAAVGLLAWSTWSARSSTVLDATVSREAELAGDLETLFSGVAEQVKRCVVSVAVVNTTKELPANGAGREANGGQSVGSGFVIDPRGYVLTNYHLVAQGGRIRVKLHDQKERLAYFVQADLPSDVALLKMDGDNDFASLPMGDSETLRVGQWVLAVGSPFGLTQTVSAGIVSALRRTDLDILPFESFIQTDASINPGNSGGPLVNLKGEVIGINTAIYSAPGGGNQGIGFAVPISLAKAFVKHWVNGRSVSYLGVITKRVDPLMARYFGLDEARGAFIADVEPDGPAARGGLRARDLVVKVGEERIRDENHLRLLIAKTAAETTIPMEVIRQGRAAQVLLKLKARHWDERAQATDAPTRQRRQARLLGLTVVTLTPEAALGLGLERETKGLLIVEVEPGSVASQRGLKASDVVLEINEAPVSSPREVRRALAERSDVAMLRIAREGGKLGYHFLPR
jgi:serine protease Do